MIDEPQLKPVASHDPSVAGPPPAAGEIYEVTLPNGEVYEIALPKKGKYDDLLWSQDEMAGAVNLLGGGVATAALPVKGLASFAAKAITNPWVVGGTTLATTQDPVRAIEAAILAKGAGKIPAKFQALKRALSGGDEAVAATPAAAQGRAVAPPATPPAALTRPEPVSAPPPRQGFAEPPIVSKPTQKVTEPVSGSPPPKSTWPPEGPETRDTIYRDIIQKEFSPNVRVQGLTPQGEETVRAHLEASGTTKAQRERLWRSMAQDERRYRDLLNLPNAALLMGALLQQLSAEDR